MSYAQGIGTLAAGVALGVLATSTYFRLWDGRLSTNEGALLRFSPDLSTQTIRRFDPNFAVCYDRRTRVPLWTIEHLTRETITMGKNVDRGNSRFREDNLIHPFFRSTNQDYSGKLNQNSISIFRFLLGSGFDRGHLIPSADHRHSQESMNNTFFLSNVAPQV
jgi:DNA/RNA endonuclease G (NUC1)